MRHAELWLPSPAMGPDEWTQVSLRMRNRAALRQVCGECFAPAISLGVDHLEVRHAIVRHQTWCRCSEEAVAEHLEAHGLEMRRAGRVLTVVELTELW